MRRVALLVLAPSLVWADVAPPPRLSAMAPMPWPRVELPAAKHTDVPIAVDGKGGKLDVSVVSAAAELDVYPSFVRTREALVLRATQDVKGLVIGTPEAYPSPERRPSSAPIDDLEVLVDGTPVVTRYVAGSLCQPTAKLETGKETALERSDVFSRRVETPYGLTELRSGLCEFPATAEGSRRGVGDNVANRWWLWAADVPAGRDVRVDVQRTQNLRYASEHHNEGVELRIEYYLAPSLVWGGVLGEATITVRTHGFDAAKLRINEASKPDERAGNVLRWVLRPADSRRVAHVFTLVNLPDEIYSDRRARRAAYLGDDVIAPRLLLQDQLFRVQLAEDKATAEDYQALVEAMLAGARSSDPAARAYARAYLADLRRVVEGQEAQRWLGAGELEEGVEEARRLWGASAFEQLEHRAAVVAEAAHQVSRARRTKLLTIGAGGLLVFGTLLSALLLARRRRRAAAP